MGPLIDWKDMVMKNALSSTVASMFLFAALTALAEPKSNQIRFSYDPPKNP